MWDEKMIPLINVGKSQSMEPETKDSRKAKKWSSPSYANEHALH